jgi:hypothetical protein
MNVISYLLNNVNCILKPSSIHGVGFFAIRDIEIGEYVFTPWLENSGIYHITQNELKLLPTELQSNILNTFTNHITYFDEMGIERSIDKDYNKIFFPLVNSCYWTYAYPRMYMNSGFHNLNVDANSVNPIVIRKIKKGKEILANYGSNFKTLPKNFI